MKTSLFLALACLVPSIATAQPSIREIDGAPFAATIAAAPAANAVAFVLNARGVRNVWVTDSTRAERAHGHRLLRGRRPGHHVARLQR